MHSSPQTLDSDLTPDATPNSFTRRFYHHPNDRMLFDSMPFGTAGYGPDMSFNGLVSERMPFQGHDPYLNPGSRIPQSQPFAPRVTPVPIKRMDVNSNTCQPTEPDGRRSAEPVVYNIPIRVEGRDDVSPGRCASPAAPVRDVAPDRRPHSPQVRRTEQQIPILRGDGTTGRQLRPGASASRQRSATPETSSSSDVPVRTVPVFESKPRDRSASPPPAPKKKKTPQEQIEEANERLKELRAEVEKFCGTSSDKQYRYLDEMLTRLLISLDTVDTEGNEELRIARKQTVRSIQSCADVLESKAKDQQQQDREQNEEVVNRNEPQADDNRSEDQGIEQSQDAASTTGDSGQQMDTEANPNATTGSEVANETSSSVDQEMKEPADNESHL